MKPFALLAVTLLVLVGFSASVAERLAANSAATVRAGLESVVGGDGFAAATRADGDI